jgi:hypothetical protein
LKIFINKKTNNTTRVVSLLGIELYKIEDTEDTRTQHFLGHFIYTKRIKSGIIDIKVYKLFGFHILERRIENDICSYYLCGRLIRQNHLAKLFFLNNLKKVKAVISLRSGFSEFLLPTGIPNISVYTKFRKKTKNAFSVDKGIEGFSMLKIPFVDKNKICEINAELYKNEDELVKQVIDALEIMLDKKECLL